jgi:hypothetical protein
VHGNREFMRFCVELAAEHGFKIANPDLQEAIAAQRQRLRPPNGPGPRPPGVGPRPESVAPASIYRRHIEEIRRDRPRARRMDASRLDADVAIRMAVTGYSREQIAKAIVDGAQTDRPHEARDWQAYARRAVQHAFGPPGEEARRHLEPLRDKLLRIEGREDERHLLRRLRGPSRGF